MSDLTDRLRALGDDQHPDWPSKHAMAREALWQPMLAVIEAAELFRPLPETTITSGRIALDTAFAVLGRAAEEETA